MNDKRIEGTWNDAKGQVKEGVGDLTDDERLEGEGRGDQLQGKLQKGVADVQDRLQDMGDRIEDEVDRRR